MSAHVCSFELNFVKFYQISPLLASKRSFKFDAVFARSPHLSSVCISAVPIARGSTSAGGH
ncbi:hypothetical protein CAMRE0001_2640 [Campylobacter rectus RM3267]|uniref:Uncharacterized protein n=1 Tax=Campylobacter rectus RM3267 TaxID=553218 RepID=B9D520_CAMRE|nr:hypothetical protein CAMRE0001_2640 [Campylobacter rectus RM3267]